jgi:hypothetical protein
MQISMPEARLDTRRVGWIAYLDFGPDRATRQAAAFGAESGINHGIILTESEATSTDLTTGDRVSGAQPARLEVPHAVTSGPRRRGVPEVAQH